MDRKLIVDVLEITIFSISLMFAIMYMSVVDHCIASNVADVHFF